MLNRFLDLTLVTLTDLCIRPSDGVSFWFGPRKRGWIGSGAVGKDSEGELGGEVGGGGVGRAGGGGGGGMESESEALSIGGRSGEEESSSSMASTAEERQLLLCRATEIREALTLVQCLLLKALTGDPVTTSDLPARTPCRPSKSLEDLQ